jgi:hypothetical protein
MDYRKFWRMWDWIYLAVDRDQKQALVDTLMNLCVCKNVGNFLSNRVIVRFLRTVHQEVSNQ